MDKKSKHELLILIEDQNKQLAKYKLRLRDLVESYKHLIKEKETLENSVKLLTETNKQDSQAVSLTISENSQEKEGSLNYSDDSCIQQLRNSLGTLTKEKARIESEFKADRKKLYQEREELEKNMLQKENQWVFEREKYDRIINELRYKIAAQQQEREKEQHDHVLMLKELQTVVTTERAAKEKLDEQISEIQQKLSGKTTERKVAEYEKCIGDLQNKLTVSQDRLFSCEKQRGELLIALEKLKDEMENLKIQCDSKVEEETNRAEKADEKLKLLTLVNEKRIANLENKISELSSVVGENDKLRQQDQTIIQNLKTRVNQLQTESSMHLPSTSNISNIFDFGESTISGHEKRNKSDGALSSESEPDNLPDNIHSQCSLEICRLKEELEQYKRRAELALKERYHKTSTALSDGKAAKEVKKLKSRILQLEDQLQSRASQLKLNEEYHNKIAANLEKSCDDLKAHHKQQFVQIEQAHKTQLMELEHQIQKQRERTLSLLEEKDKEIGQLKSSFLTAIIHPDPKPTNESADDCFEPPAENPNQDITTRLLSASSLLSGKKEGHILHYLQELSRKDVELSNLRHVRMKSETSLRKLEQELAEKEMRYMQELELLQSRIKLLESSQDEKGTNVEYLKNVILRFLKCQDSKSKRHMVNAIATVLHFTSSEIQDIKTCIK